VATFLAGVLAFLSSDSDSEEEEDEEEAAFLVSLEGVFGVSVALPRKALKIPIKVSSVDFLGTAS
jgi:uncharacterized membrane protein